MVEMAHRRYKHDTNTKQYYKYYFINGYFTLLLSHYLAYKFCQSDLTMGTLWCILVR